MEKKFRLNTLLIVMFLLVITSFTCVNVYNSKKQSIVEQIYKKGDIYTFQTEKLMSTYFPVILLAKVQNRQ